MVACWLRFLSFHCPLPAHVPQPLGLGSPVFKENFLSCLSQHLKTSSFSLCAVQQSIVMVDSKPRSHPLKRPAGDAPHLHGSSSPWEGPRCQPPRLSLLYKPANRPRVIYLSLHGLKVEGGSRE